MLIRLVQTVVVSASAAVCLYAQNSTPAFEVASIRPAIQITTDMIREGKAHVGMKTDAGRVDIGFASLKELIPLAYGVKAHQVTGPDWLGTQRYDIVATMPEGATKEQIPALLQTLLADRFHLKLHRESREQNVYALIVAKGGHKMKEGSPEPELPAASGAKADVTIGVGNEQVSMNRTASGATVRMGNNTTKVAMGAGGTIRMEMSRLSMPMLVDQLTPMLDKPVVDLTELKGEYELALELSMADVMAAARAAGANMSALGAPAPPPPPGGAAPSGPAASDPSGGSIFNSIQQLGLKLEGRKAPVETIVVDSVDKSPTEN